MILIQIQTQFEYPDQLSVSIQMPKTKVMIIEGFIMTL